MIVLGLDVNLTETAFVELKTARVLDFATLPNSEAMTWRGLGDPANVTAIEMVGHYGSGMSVGTEVFETCVWIGRILASKHLPGKCILVSRGAIKLHLCRSARAKDSHIRQALIDLWGGESVALGRKKCPDCKGKKYYGRKNNPTPCQGCNQTGWLVPPGPLSGIAGHEWSALAVAVFVRDFIVRHGIDKLPDARESDRMHIIRSMEVLHE